MTADERPTTHDDLPDGWVWTALEEVVEIGAEQVLPLDYPKRQFNYLALENISQGTGEIVNFMPTLGAHIKSNKFKFTPEHVLYGKLRPYLRKAVAPDFNGISATDLLPLKPVARSMDRHFLAWWLLSPQILEYVVKRQTDVKMPRLRSRDLKQMPVPLPPLAEQQRIVAKIEALFAQSRRGREALDAVPDLLAQFRQAVLAAAFRGELTERDPADEPAFVLLERIRAERRRQWEVDLRAQGKDPNRHKYKEPAPPDTSDLPQLPEGWGRTTVEQLASSKPRSIQSGPFGSSLRHSEFQDTGILAIGIDNVLEWRFSMGKQHRISPEKFEQLKKYAARPLDVLITVMATVGRCCVVPVDLELAIVTKHVYRITAHQDLIDPFFLMFCLGGAPEVRRQIAEQIRGQTRPGINGAILKGLTVPVPPLSEQRRTVARIEALLAQADVLETQVTAVRRRLEQVDQAVLARAFRGELVPQDPDDEPASVLLERIRKEREAHPAKKQTRKSRSSTKEIQQPKLF